MCNERCSFIYFIKKPQALNDQIQEQQQVQIVGSHP